MGSGTVAPVSDAAYPFPNKVRLPVAFRRGYPAKDTTNKRMWQPGGLPHPCFGSRKIKESVPLIQEVKNHLSPLILRAATAGIH